MILTNPCQEIYLEDWFPEDRIDKQRQILTGDEIASYMDQFLLLVKEQIDDLLPGHRNMSVDELKSWTKLFLSFDPICAANHINPFIGIILMTTYKSLPVNIDQLLYCIKVCRNVFTELGTPYSFSKQTELLREFSIHVHKILGDLIPPRTGSNGV